LGKTLKPGRGGLAALGIFSGFCGERLFNRRGREERPPKSEENHFYFHFHFHLHASAHPAVK
jgi:hypothetical protein